MFEYHNQHTRSEVSAASYRLRAQSLQKAGLAYQILEFDL